MFGTKKIDLISILKQLEVKYKLKERMNFEKNKKLMYQIIYQMQVDPRYPERDMVYLSLRMIDKYWKKHLNVEDLPFLEKLSITKPWWYQNFIMSKFFTWVMRKQGKLQKEKAEEYSKSENPFLRRISLQFLVAYKKKLDKKTYFGIATNLILDQDEHVQRSLGQSLKRYSRYESMAVLKFLQKNEKDIQKSTRKEAMKLMRKYPKKFVGSKGLSKGVEDLDRQILKTESLNDPTYFNSSKIMSLYK